jgi:exosome complex RNA-binding protein Csl4
MRSIRYQVRGAMAVLAASILSACSQAGQLGEILGGVLGGGGGGNMVSGAIRSVDTRNQQISLEQSNGQAVALAYDNQTKVVYQNQLYSVANLESGDRVNARVQQLQNGGYYVDSVAVTQSVTGSTTTGGSNVQSLQGNVRQIDRTNGVFTVDAGNGVTLTVSLPYNATSTDVNKFNALRSGDYVRFYGVYLSSTRVELRQFN